MTLVVIRLQSCNLRLQTKDWTQKGDVPKYVYLNNAEIVIGFEPEEIKPSDWMLQDVWLVLTNHIALI